MRGGKYETEQKGNARFRGRNSRDEHMLAIAHAEYRMLIGNI